MVEGEEAVALGRGAVAPDFSPAEEDAAVPRSGAAEATPAAEGGPWRYPRGGGGGGGGGGGRAARQTALVRTVAAQITSNIRGRRPAATMLENYRVEHVLLSRPRPAAPVEDDAAAAADAPAAPAAAAAPTASSSAAASLGASVDEAKPKARPASKTFDAGRAPAGLVWSGNARGSVVRSCLVTGENLGEWQLHSLAITSLVADGSLLYSSSWDRAIKVCRVGPYESLTCLHVNQEHEDAVQMIRLGAQHVVSCSVDGTIRYIDRTTARTVVRMTNSSPVRCIQLDGPCCWSGDNQGHLSMWDQRAAGELRPQMTLCTDVEKVMCLDLHGSRIAAAGDCVRRTIRYPISLFDVRAQREVRSLYGHTDRVWSLQLSQNRLVSGSRDTSVRVWDTNGAPQCDLYRHVNSIYWLQFSPWRLVTASADRTVLVWDFSAK